MEKKKGKRPEPTDEEIAFIYERFARGMSVKEIQFDMEDTDFSLRTDPRLFRKLKRYFDLANKVLDTERDPLLGERIREHEKILVGLFQWLEPPGISHEIIHYWNWERQESDKWLRDEREKNMMALPTDFDFRCLLDHFDPEDSILVHRYEAAELSIQNWDLCHDLYVRFVNKAKELGIPFMTNYVLPCSMISPRFVDILSEVASNKVRLSKSIREPEYHTEVCAEDRSYSRLFFRGEHIGAGTASEVAKIEERHRKMLSEITEDQPQIVAIRKVRERYHRIASELSDAIRLKKRRKDFKKGPCEVCEIWGGLPGY